MMDRSVQKGLFDELCESERESESERERERERGREREREKIYIISGLVRRLSC